VPTRVGDEGHDDADVLSLGQTWSKPHIARIRYGCTGGTCTAGDSESKTVLIFAGGYAAGYYSYKWAEVLSADAFSAFEEEGLFNPAVSRRFRDTVLAQGGSKPAMDIFVEFRGRKPELEPLLRQSGLVEEAA